MEVRLPSSATASCVCRTCPVQDRPVSPQLLPTPQVLSLQVEFSWKPTPPSQRPAAIAAYIEGEDLCEAGSYQLGVQKLKEATRLGWELNGEQWPGWANSLYAKARGEPSTAATAVLIAHDAGAWQPEIAALPRDSPDWWRADAATSTIHAALAQRSVVIIDNVCGAHLSSSARAECAAASADGTLMPAHVRTPTAGPTGAQGPETRS